MKYLHKKGPKKVISTTFVESGQNVRVLACTNVSRSFHPTSLCRRIGFPNGTKVITADFGWINEDAFFLWFQKFRTPGQRVLILDGHVSHTNLEALEFCEAS